MSSSRAVSRSPGPARRTESVDEFVREDAADLRRAFVPRHLDAVGVVQKIIQVESKSRFVTVGADDVAKQLDEARLAVGREPHDLAFVAVVREADELCRRSVDDAGGVRVFDMVQDLE